MKNRREIFRNAFLMVFAPLCAAVIPLFFYRSENPWIGSYSQKYAAFLFAAVVVMLAWSLRTAFSSKAKNNYAPATNALTLIISVFAMFALTEMVLRWKFNDSFAEYAKWGHKRSIFFGTEVRPNYRWQFAGATYTTDETGFRTNVSGRDWRNTDGVKIFVIGGSSAFGYGLNDDQTWEQGLQADLRRRLASRNPYVIDAGNMGHNSLQILFRTYLRVLPLKPTHILFYENYNDVSPSKRAVDSIGIGEEVLFSKTMADYLAQKHAKENFYQRTVLFHLLTESNLFNSRDDKDPQDEPDWDWATQENNGALFVRNIRALAKLCELDRVQLVLTTFIYDDVNISKNESRTIKYYNQLLRDFAQESGVTLIDLEALFVHVTPKEEYFFEDHYHPNPKGAEFIARNIADYFVEHERQLFP